jgi:hypothetical protein
MALISTRSTSVAVRRPGLTVRKTRVARGFEPVENG